MTTMNGRVRVNRPWSAVGAKWALHVRHPPSPMLRVRYRAGVPIDRYGYPQWPPFARVMVRLPPSDPWIGRDEGRVLDLLAANRIVAERSGDPLWTDAAATPAGWTWAHQARSRMLALVPVELHGAFRHQGGASTDSVDHVRRGLTGVAGDPPRIVIEERLSVEAVVKVEEHLGYRFPQAYRDFLRRSNGARPSPAAVHPACGFVADQRFFGMARGDWLQDLVYANAFFGDRLTSDFLAVGYVQGGLVAVRVRGGDEGSVWWYDDDDPRDRDDYTADDVCTRLLRRVADDFTAFWYALRPPPPALVERAATFAADPRSAVIKPSELGRDLPQSHRR